MIELNHLRIIQALADNGSLTEAANALFVTQPALTHQIRYLEKKLEVKLWERDGRKLRLTQSGELLLKVARQILPVMQQAEQTLKAYAEGLQGILRLGVECHPCYEWLKGTVADYLVAMPDMDVDIVHKFQFSGLEGLLNYHIDLLVTPDLVKHEQIYYASLFDYELVLLIDQQHDLLKKDYVVADDLASELLLTFPVAHERLDIYTQFLMPAGITPKHKPMESLEIMIQMVRLGRGVTVLPDWMARQYCEQLPVAMLRLGEQGLKKTLYAAMRHSERDIKFMRRFVEISQAKTIKG